MIASSEPMDRRTAAIEMIRAAMTAAVLETIDELAAMDLSSRELVDAVFYGSLGAACGACLSVTRPEVHDRIGGMMIGAVPLIMDVVRAMPLDPLPAGGAQ